MKITELYGKQFKLDDTLYTINKSSDKRKSLVTWKEGNAEYYNSDIIGYVDSKEWVLIKEKPTLKQVKKHFKNAKEVRCLSDEKVYEIDTKTIKDDAVNIWCESKKNVGVQLYNIDTEKYAEIISYKENPKKIIVKDAEIVSETDFDKVIKNTFNHIENLLVVKGKEYQRNGNVFHNFDSGANITGQTPERILNGFLLKHLISYNDMLNDIENGKNPSEALIEEKFNDIITYFAIQKAQILKRIK